MLYNNHRSEYTLFCLQNITWFVERSDDFWQHVSIIVILQLRNKCRLPFLAWIYSLHSYIHWCIDTKITPTGHITAYIQLELYLMIVLMGTFEVEVPIHQLTIENWITACFLRGLVSLHVWTFEFSDAIKATSGRIKHFGIW